MTQHRRDAIEWFLMLVAWLILSLAVSAARGQCGPGGCPVGGRGVGVGIGIGVGGWRSPPRQSPAQEPAQDAPPAACRIGNSVRGSISYGTGTLVQYDGLVAVITVRHLFADGAGELQLMFPGGQTVTAAGAHTDATGADLAVILLDSPPAGVAPLAIAADHPTQGTAVRGGGFGPNGQWRWISGQCLGYVHDKQGAAAASCFEISSPARQGDSGGPVLNERGELCGVIWGTGPRQPQAIATYSGKIRAFLGRVAAKVGRSQPTQPSAPTNPPVVGPIDPVPAQPATPPATPGQQAGQQPQPPPQLAPQIQERLDSLARILEQQATASGTLAQATSGLDQRIADRLGPVITGAMPAAKGVLETIFPAIVGSATGVGIPAAAFWALAWLARRRKAGTQPATARQGSQPQDAVASPAVSAPTTTATTTTATSTLQPPASPVKVIPVVVEQRPTPQQVVTQREFVEVAKPCNACKANRMAHDLYVQRYPGSGQGTIAAIEEYAKQFLSGLNAGSASTSS